MSVKKTICLGCQLATKKLPVSMVYENEFVCCILDHDPFNEGHILILTKKHVEEADELDTETANAVMKASQLLSKTVKELFEPDGVTICQNGGIFSELTHYHMHVVPRFQGQKFASFYTEENWDNQYLKNRLPETQRKMMQQINMFL